ncbi:radical SAM protein [Alicyclobacillus ferrooxydans]|uniref:radical SAM protein n=1 Tax=Alicyclobacillus ferrooxydans TaxID=471514 RepID=UPI0006D592B6|nr:radical SAM protein [Alicyclobacillus ferrooxydans]
MTIQNVRAKDDTLQVHLQFPRGRFDKLLPMETVPIAFDSSFDLFCHFDRTGRFVRATGRDLTIRRGLDNRLLLIAIDITHREDLKWFGRRRTYHDFSKDQKNAFYRTVYEAALAALSYSDSTPDCPESDAARFANSRESLASRGDALRWTELLQQWTPEALAADEAAFQRTYKPISILPPDQYKTLVVQVAEGCSYNRCLFCDFYRDRRFHVKTPAELEQHLGAIQSFFGPRLQDRTGVFLGDGNALVVSADRLLVAIKQIRESLGPLAASFATFMDTFNLDKKSIEALYTLREAGIDTVYVGLESGYDPLREFLKKPGPGSEALAAIRTLKQAGFTVGPIVMVGVGDRRYADEHFSHTVQLLKAAELTRVDKVFLSPFVLPSHGEYIGAAEHDDIIPYTEDEIEREMMRWKSALNQATAAKVTGYYVREHIY